MTENKTFITEMTSINEIFDLLSREIEINEEKKVAPTRLIGAVTGLIFGGVLGGILGGIIDGEENSKINLGSSSFTVPQEKYDQLLNQAVALGNTWKEDLSAEDRISALYALINGCSLYCVEKDICKQIIRNICDDNEVSVFLSAADIIYEQLEPGGHFFSETVKKMRELYPDGKLPYVVYLYTAAEAILTHVSSSPSPYGDFPKEAIDAYFSIPENYRDFLIGNYLKPSSNPAIHQFLLPCFFASFDSSDGRYFININDSPTYLKRVSALKLYIPIDKSLSGGQGVAMWLRQSLDKQKYETEADEKYKMTQSILRDFAHTCGNMTNSRLQKIAEKIIQKGENDSELRTLGRMLLLEATEKNDLLISIKMLHLRCREDTERLGGMIKSSIVKSGSDDGCGIDDIVNSALLLSLNRTLYDASSLDNTLALNNLLQSEPRPDVRKRYDKIVYGSGRPCIDFLQSFDPPIRINIESAADFWKRLRVYRNSFLFVLLEDLLGELFFNLLKYGDLRKDILLYFGEDPTSFFVLMQNSINENGEEISYSGKGLASRNKTLELLNGTSFESVSTSESDDVFQTLIRLSKYLDDSEPDEPVA